MKSFLYILQSQNGTYYVGSTSDLTRRLKQHEQGQTSTTKRLGAMTLVFSQEFESLHLARAAEQRIKRWKRKDFIKKVIQDGKIKE